MLLLDERREGVVNCMVWTMSRRSPEVDFRGQKRVG